MQERVECERCGAHKDRAIWAGHCFVCGSLSFRPVPLNLHDLRELAAGAADAAEEAGLLTEPAA